MRLNRVKASKGLKVISIGDLNVDLIIRLENLPTRGGNEIAQTFQMTAGGTAGNFAVGVSRLGVDSGLITRIGSDEFTHFLLNGLKEEGVDISHIFVGKELSNNKIVVIIDKDDIKTCIASLGSIARLDQMTGDIEEEYIAHSDLLGVSGVSLLLPSMTEITLKAMEIAKKNNVTISFDPNLRLGLSGLSKEHLEYFRKAIMISDVFLPNEEEIEYLTQEKELNKAANTVLEWGPKIIALKKGPLGCKIITESSEDDYQAFQVNVVDVTGAGDAFDAAFIVGYIQGWSLNKVAHFANAVGALKVTRMGAQAGLPYRREVEVFLNNHKK